MQRMRYLFPALAGLLLSGLLSACAGTPQTAQLLQTLPAKFILPHELTHTPFYPQEQYQCGPAALATLISQQGLTVDLDKLTRRVYIPERKGSLQIELVSAAREYKLIPYVIEAQLTTLLNEVLAGRPVLVLQNLGVSWYPKWHYAVVVGYNVPERELILRSGTIKRYVMSLRTFEYTWQRSKRWGLILLKPGELPEGGSALMFMKSLLGFESNDGEGKKDKWSILIPAYQAAVVRWPNALTLKMGYGNSLFSAKQYTLALAEYEKVISVNNVYAPAYNNAAQIYALQGNTDVALNYVQRAIELGGVHIDEYQSTLNDIHRVIRKN